MTLIKSVSGMRGTIGGRPGNGLTPIDIVEFAAAYGTWLRSRHKDPTVVVGRDGRISGPHVQTLVTETLLAMGVDVIDVGQSTTPSVEMYVPSSNAQGGIILTASHNPEQWNALKFLNEKGEFISAQDGNDLLDIMRNRDFNFPGIGDFGSLVRKTDAISRHIDAICALDLVDTESVKRSGYHVVVDCINSTGALAIPVLLDALGCRYTLINDAVDGKFAHDPEPLPHNLADLMSHVVEQGADLGIAVDPDVDRLAFVNPDGSYFGEEYTLVAIADYILSNGPGNTVSNLSSSLALRDITKRHGGSYFASAVGEVHVVAKMKEVQAVIGGEGNGGIIYPALHYGRDALVGIALMLTYMSKTGKTALELRSSYPDYQIVKSKLELTRDIEADSLAELCRRKFPEASFDYQDGVKMTFENEWLHIRKSNTEPVLRIYAESTSTETAQRLADRISSEIRNELRL